MTELVLTAPEPAHAQPLTLLQQIEAFAGRNSNSIMQAGQVGHLVAKFISETRLAPALEGEPVFVLRAADRIAPFIVKKWADEAEYHRCPKDKIDGADLIAANMIAFQMKHPDRVKYPD